MSPESPISHHISSGPSTSRKHNAKPTCSKFETTIIHLRDHLSERSPVIGCNTANPNILIVNNNPSMASEPEYFKINVNRAIVLNHSPIIEITAANQKVRNFLLVLSNS